MSSISVLMSTYHREHPDYLDAAMDSIWTQQVRRPEQIVLVEDGPLTDALYAVIRKWKDTLSDTLTIVEKTQNGGLAAALNDGIAVCQGDLIARMDSDDIAMPERFLLQERYMKQHPEVDVLGGALREFNDEGTLSNVRRYPATMTDVLHTMYRVSPVGHPSSMFRRSVFDEGHRYSSRYHICEDVTMWYDLACAGKVINNIPDVILNFRRNDSMMNRRSHEKAWSEFLAYNDGIYRLWGLFTYKYAYSLARMIFRLMPAPIIKMLYNGRLRKIIAKE